MKNRTDLFLLIAVSAMLAGCGVASASAKFPNNSLLVSRAGSQPHLRIDRNEIWFTSSDIGFQVVRFSRPLAELLGPAPVAQP